jgi:hypothetical protein
VSHRNTALRKYVATVIQVLDLPDYQKSWVARFLGHNLSVHYKFYQQDPLIVNLAKMSKVMMLVDQGKVREAEGLDINQLEQFHLTAEDVFDEEVEEVTFDTKQMLTPAQSAQPGTYETLIEHVNYIQYIELQGPERV